MCGDRAAFRFSTPEHAVPVRAVLCWTEGTGYTAANWRALASRDDIELRVLAHHGGGSHGAFNTHKLVEGLPVLVKTPEEWAVPGAVKDAVLSFEPDAVVTSGWMFPPYTRFVTHEAPRDLPIAACVNNQWHGTLRQRLAPILKRGMLRRFDRMMVTNDRSYAFARGMGFRPDQIHIGTNGFDYAGFERAGRERDDAPSWPRRFLFVGQYIERKGVDVLASAYRRYRSAVAEPWELTCCGRGPLGDVLRGIEGVTDRGFVQPFDLPSVMAEHGAFVFPSRYETWGAVIAEAAASGLPVVCTTGAASWLDIIRPYYTGMVLPPGDEDSLTEAMLWLHAHEGRLAEMGRRGRVFAGAFAADVWAERWAAMLQSMARAGR
jgi:glycosyltransferase involved in cell wall biosynthesis